MAEKITMKKLYRFARKSPSSVSKSWARKPDPDTISAQLENSGRDIDRYLSEAETGKKS